jgi:hypothetical protein
MLTQHREDVLRLIRQHDHALLAGALAFAWRGPDGAGIPWTTALATALHDVVWMEEDRIPRVDPVTGAPYDFTTLPPALKRAFVDAGVERLATLDPEVAALVSAHHRTLATRASVDPDPPLAWLRFFDNLSLFLCLTAPGTTSIPPWLSDSLTPPAPLTLRWLGPDSVGVRPYPFGAPVRGVLPYRDVPRRRYPDQGALSRAWNDATTHEWFLRLTGEDSPPAEDAHPALK